MNAATVEGLELTDEGRVQGHAVFVVEHGDVNVGDLLKVALKRVVVAALPLILVGREDVRGFVFDDAADFVLKDRLLVDRITYKKQKAKEKDGARNCDLKAKIEVLGNLTPRHCTPP